MPANDEDDEKYETFKHEQKWTKEGRLLDKHGNPAPDNGTLDKHQREILKTMEGKTASGESVMNTLKHMVFGKRADPAQDPNADYKEQKDKPPSGPTKR